MEKWRLIGFRKVDFTDPKTKSRITGYSLFVCRPGADGIEGDECQKIFIGDRISYVPALGDQIQIVYNRFGRVADVVLA